MARSLSRVRLLAVLVAAIALAGALPATRFAALAQDDTSQTEATTDAGTPPAEEPPAEEPPAEEPPAEEPPAEDDTTDTAESGETGNGTAADGQPPADPPADDSVGDEPSTDEPTSAEPPADVPSDAATPDVSTDEAAETADSGATEQPAPAAPDFTAQQTVEVTLTKTDDQSNPLGAACFAVYEELPGGAFGDFVAGTCTNEQGQIVFNLEPGDYVLVEEEAPAGFLAIDNVSFTVEPATPLSLGPFADQPSAGDGTLEIHKVDDQAAALEGSCIEVYQDLDSDSGELQRGALVFSFCDEGNGSLVIARSQAPGNYIVVESTTPAGFVTADDIEATVESNETTLVTIVNVPAQGNEPGSIVVTKRDPFQDLLIDACFELFVDTDVEVGEFSAGTQIGSEVCDDDDGIVDGETVFLDLAPGQYVLVETVAPDGFQLADDREVIVIPGQATNVTVTDEELPEQSGFVFNKEFESLPLPTGEQACFEFRVDLDEDPGEVDPGDLLAGGGQLCTDGDGQVLSRNQEPGFYVAIEVVTPAGYRTSDPVEIVIEGEREVVEVTMFNELADPNDPATLQVTKLGFVGGVGSSPLEGACFRLFEANDGERGAAVTETVCDDDDGDDDALISLTAQAGDYVLGEVVVPSGFDAGPDALVTLEPGQVHAITVTNIEDDGVSSFTFFKEFEGGPLPEGEEACFEFRVDLDEDPGQVDPGDLLEGSGQLCTDEDGEVLSRNQEPGFYVVIEVVTPAGYQTSDPIEFVIESVEDDIEITMINELLAVPTPTTAATAPAGPTATTAVSTLPSTGAGSAEDGQALLLLGLLVLGIGATGWGVRRAVARRAA